MKFRGKPMIKSRQIAVFLSVAALTVAACSTSPTGRSQMIWKSDAELAAESARQFAEMTASMPLVTDRATIDYIACVANAVVLVLDPPYSEIEWEMRIFDNEAINAFAMPGGKIGIFDGILNAAQNQDQLAAVIGHEIAHVTARHVNERASRGSITDVGIQVAAVILGGGHSGATYTAYEALNHGAALGIMLPFNRGQESEADIVGLEYMARAGFDPRQAVPLWKNMGAQQEKAPAEFMSTHPSNETRTEQLISEWPKVLPYYNQAIEEGRRADCTPPPRPEG
jgi:predicted Zn-dependent protease